MPGGGCALPGLRAVSARSATIQAGQAQRRPATGSRLCCRLNARWRLRLTGPTGCLCPLRNDPGRASAAPPGNGCHSGNAQPGLAAAVGRPSARGDQKRQMEMVLCRLTNDKINLRSGKNALAPDAGKPRPRFRG